MVVEKLVGTTKMKKKLLVGGVFVTLLLWLVTDRSPIQLLISFIAAGALPGVQFTFSPYIMFGIALAGGVAILWMFPGLIIHMPQPDETEEMPISTLKITANTHQPKAKTKPNHKQRHKSKAKRKRHNRPRQLRAQTANN